MHYQDDIRPDAPLPAELAGRGFRFGHRFRVRYRDIDMQGIVFNGNYMSYIDYGITEYFRKMGYPWKRMESAGFDLAVVRAVQEFRGPAFLDDIITVGVRVTRVGNASFTAQFAVWRQDEETGEEGLVLEAEFVYVNYDMSTRRSRPIPAVIRQGFKEMEGVVEGL